MRSSGVELGLIPPGHMLTWHFRPTRVGCETHNEPAHAMPLASDPGWPKLYMARPGGVERGERKERGGEREERGEEREEAKNAKRRGKSQRKKMPRK